MNDLIESLHNRTSSYNNYRDNDDRVTSVDMSFKSLKCFPIIMMDYLQHLYLENNNITELPETLFVDAANLKWLDVRNNAILTIPSSIENNKSVETMLFQNNQLTFLPKSLGTVTNLKSLQLTGNPIIYPQKNIIKCGTENILKYLLEDYNKEKKRVAREDRIDISLLNCEEQMPEDTTIMKPKYKRIYNEHYKIMKSDFNTCFESIEEEPVKEVEIKKALSNFRTATKPLPKYSNSKKYLNKLMARDKDEMTLKMQETMMQEMWNKKKTELLSKREKVLQDRKSLEALKHWRIEYRDAKIDNTNTYYALDLSNIPYDTNLDCVKILTRADIEKDLPDKYRKNIRNKCKTAVRKPRPKPNIQMKIAEMMESMDIAESENMDCTPEEKQRMVTKEIKKLNDLKKKIVNLKMVNDSYT